MADTSIPATSFGTIGFRVGRVFSTTGSLFSRNFLKFFVVTAVAALPVLWFQSGAMVEINQSLRAGTKSPAAALGLIFGVLLFWIVLNLLSQAVIVHGAFQDMRSRPVNLGESLVKGLSRFVPVLLLGLCVGICFILGFMLLIVPGLILVTMWAVATPACVVERLGPLRSMGRSRELTKGSRWKVFGIIILLGVVSSIIGGVLQGIVPPMAGNIVGLVGIWIWNTLYGTFSGIIVAVMYHELRAAKDGVDIEQMAAVFD